MAVDPSGNLVVAGTTDSGDFPVIPHAYQRSFGAASVSGFIARFDPTGSNLIYATYLAGRADTAITAMALDSGGNVVVAGTTALPGSFPATAGAYQTPNATGFVAKLNAAGDRLTFAATIAAAPSALALDAAGNVYLTGPAGVDFPTTPGVVQSANRGAADTFVLKLSADGSRNPVERGSVIAFYAAGAGAMTPLIADGAISPTALPLPVPVLPVSDHPRRSARVVYAGSPRLHRRPDPGERRGPVEYRLRQ